MDKEQAQLSWSRANKLAELAGIAPPAARNYISTLKKDTEEGWRQLTTLLDGDKDARNGIIRNHIDLAKAHKTPQRASKGDPTRSPRAGAPAESSNGTEGTAGVDINLLRALKKLLTKGYALEDIQTGCKFIQELRS